MDAQLMDLHQRVYNNEVLLADKHGEILVCYRNMVEKHKEYVNMQSQIAQLRKDLAAEVQDLLVYGLVILWCIYVPELYVCIGYVRLHVCIRR